jgi:hypothetical protein
MGTVTLVEEAALPARSAIPPELMVSTIFCPGAHEPPLIFAVMVAVPFPLNDDTLGLVEQVPVEKLNLELSYWSDSPR